MSADLAESAVVTVELANACPGCWTCARPRGRCGSCWAPGFVGSLDAPMPCPACKTEALDALIRQRQRR